MASDAARRAAQRRLAREIKTGTYKPSSIGQRARQAASIGSSAPSDIRADLEERAFRHAVALFGDTSKFNRYAVETRIKGGVIVTRANGRHKDSDYFPMATLDPNGDVHDADGFVSTPWGNAKVVQVAGMSNEQLRNAISMSRDEWSRMAGRKLGHGRFNHWMYH